MNEQELRLECLRLAKTYGSSESVLPRAQRFASFVQNQPLPSPNADEAITRLRDHLAEQIIHAGVRIRDGVELGATVWRLALEDIIRENEALLCDLFPARSSPVDAGTATVAEAGAESIRPGGGTTDPTERTDTS